MKRSETQLETGKRIIAKLKESLDPGTCRGLVDAFLTHKKNLEVRHFHSTVTAETLSRDKKCEPLSFCPVCLILISFLCSGR